MIINKPYGQLMRKESILVNNEDFSTQLTSFSNNQYHSHDFYEIFYVLEGNSRQILNNETTTLSTGDLFILRPNKDSHSFLSDSGKLFIHRDVIIETSLFKETAEFLSPGLFNELENATNPFYLKLSIDALKELESKFLQLNKQLDNKKELILSKQLLVDILSLTLLNTTKEDGQLPIWLNTLLSTFNHSTNLPLSKVLEDFNYSQAYMCRIFKKYMGTTMTEYFNEIKLHKAYMLLKTTDISISELLLSVGFENKTHFYRCFKNKFGKTPKEIRNEIKNP